MCDFRERFRRGAFADVLANDPDVSCAFNHRSNDLPLGGTTSGTLRLQENDIGLRFGVDLPDAHHARDLVAAIERGDVAGTSFAFVADEEEVTTENGLVVREVRSVRSLHDVGPVTFPAYP